jgi:hypothetical protein
MTTRAMSDDERELNGCGSTTQCAKPAKYDVNGDGACRVHLAQLVEWWHTHGRTEVVVKPWRIVRGGAEHRDSD